MGCWYFNCCDWKKITEFILKKRIPLKSIVSKLYDLDDVDETFRLFDSGRTQKIVRPSILYFKVSIWYKMGGFFKKKSLQKQTEYDIYKLRYDIIQ